MNRFDLTHSPLALYHFDRNLEDASGNGFDLAGTASYRELEPQRFELAPGSSVSRPSHDAALALTGDMTVEVLGRFYGVPNTQVFASFTATGETLATNTLWQFGPQTATGFRWLQESGASGADSTALSSGAVEALPAPGATFHAAAVLSGNVIRFYLNGRPFGSPSATLTTGDGGTSAVLKVMLGATSFGLLGLKIVGIALTAAEIKDEYIRTLGDEYGPPLMIGKLWVGALTDTSATVVAKMSGPVDDLTLEISDGTATWQSSPQTTDADNVARFDLTGLDPDTEYTFAIPGVSGALRTAPVAAGSPGSFLVAFSGDANLGSNHAVFSTILNADPLMFIHMGDLHYQNIATNSPALFQAAYDGVLASAVQHRLYRGMPTAYVWDDHDFGGNNCDGTSASKPAAGAAYRSRVPHYALPHATAVYQTWDIGRVRFIMTDQRSEATPNAATDNASKSMLGSDQKTWFKDLIANSPDMLLVWICPRWFGNAAHPDSWNNFSTERTELCDWIKANAHGRVVVLSADQHYIGIDDGTNVDHATGGGEPLPTFQAAPLDQSASATGGTWTHGNVSANGQFGTMAIADTGGATIGVTWEGRNSAGTLLASHTFAITL